MPEGHTIHRAARDHRRVLAGRVLAVSSPQGRFAEGAGRIDGKRCLSVEAYGKHLLYGFEGGETLHIHLGLFGRFRVARLPSAEPRGAVRVRLVGATHVVDVNGPNTCRLLDEPERLALVARIGPDVLRSDADPDRAFARISGSRAAIGRLIMDQSVMAGIGNIYRSEILWRQAVHPETPGRAIDRETFDRIWQDAKALLAIGVKRNAIVTVDGAPASRTRYGERVNIFGKDSCPACLGEIRRFEMDGRRAFVCEQCQPLEAAAEKVTA
ncbi:Fpg/Nei family DNA glycosylase [Pelagibius sp.]|uniref:Fpg/Nei family DNA glycosylase n=1 Tax=Pelagibius sp. TaxID=1931238 RepID=UPI003B513B09